MEIIIAVILGTPLLALGLGTFVIRNLYYICQPSEVLIFAGSSRRLPNGRRVGYRLVKGGSSLRIPLMEKTFKMDLSNTIVELRVTNAYSKGGIPLNVEGVANIKIAGEQPTIDNAIERLLGKTRQEIERIAQETLEGNLRGVLASLTPEQVNEDKIAFAKSLLDEAEEDLEKLGLVLDNLQIQNISDEVGYLDSIGRQQSAELVRDARIAEAQARAASAIRTAENDRVTAIERIERDLEIFRAEAERRVQDAMTKRLALVAEAQAEIGSEVARTQAEVAVQRERIEQVKQQLQADVVAPAEAQCKRAIAEAKGNAAQIVEDGKAQALGTKRLTQSWQAAGSKAREIFLYQKLEVLLKTIADTVPEVEVDKVTAIDSRHGNNAAKIASFLEQVRSATGLDVPRAVAQIGDRAPSSPTAIGSDGVLSLASEPGSRSPASSLSHEQALRSQVRQVLGKIATQTSNLQEVEGAIEAEIRKNPTLKRNLRQVLKRGGTPALKALFDDPNLQVSVTLLAAWIESD
jgi:flotillin